MIFYFSIIKKKLFLFSYISEELYFFLIYWQIFVNIFHLFEMFSWSQHFFFDHRLVLLEGFQKLTLAMFVQKKRLTSMIDL